IRLHPVHLHRPGLRHGPQPGGPPGLDVLPDVRHAAALRSSLRAAERAGHAPGPRELAVLQRDPLRTQRGEWALLLRQRDALLGTQVSNGRQGTVRSGRLVLAQLWHLLRVRGFLLPGERHLAHYSAAGLHQVQVQRLKHSP
ncbi:unnamed protein product, partial [Ixodes persulcatus]